MVKTAIKINKNRVKIHPKGKTRSVKIKVKIRK